MRKVTKIFLMLMVFLQLNTLTAQIVNPVKWHFNTAHVEGNEYDIFFTAQIDENWAVYSQYLERDDGPIATAIAFELGDHFELIGKSEEDIKTKKEGYDALFNMNLVKFYKTMKITQRVILKDFTKPVEGYLTFMTCDESRCLPPSDVDFSLKFEAKTTLKVKVTPKVKTTIKEGRTDVMEPIEGDMHDGVEKKVNGTTKVEIEEGDKKKQLSDIEESSIKENVTATEKLYGLSSISSNSMNDCTSSTMIVGDKQSKTLFGIFILGLLGGLLALLTPCVFPLIPLTVSFFTKGSENKKKGLRDAILYGIFIFSVYALLSLPFHLLDSINPDILNEISTNVWLNVGFFLVFMFFAFSFFGYYEITMPSLLTNKISSAEGVGGILGIFFMALTLSLVSFSCTGPILGSLLAGSLNSGGGAWQLTAGMSGFGLALALPFTLFAMFPGWLNKLPKSGEWLNSVKVVLGFVEFSLALKFLSNADLVMHWGILKYELFMLLWIAIGVSLSLYVFGFLRFPHDTKHKQISLFRIGLGLFTIALTIYLAFGLTYNKDVRSFNSLKLLSGLAPPTGYSWIYPNECPNNISCFKDLESGLAYAQKQNKPILLDFTGYACVNCRKMEEHVWSDAQVYDLINDDYVLISLYVDDKKELPKEEKIEVERVQGGIRKLKNYGHKWAHFQTKFFNTNSQPYYVLLSSNGRLILNQPIGYTPDIEEYIEFLECGIESLKNF